MNNTELQEQLSEKENEIEELNEKVEELETHWDYLTLTSEGLEIALKTFFSSASEEEKEEFNSKYPTIADLFQ